MSYESYDPINPLNPETLLEAQRISTLLALATDYEKEEGIDPFGLYCAHTGRKLGRLDADSIRLILLATPPMDDDHFLAESLTRTLLACRPSPAWFKLTDESFHRLIKADPVGAAVRYLMLAFEPIKRPLLKPIESPNTPPAFLDSDAQAQWNMLRIRLFNALAQYDSSSLIKLTNLLVHIDGRIGLKRVKVPEGFTVESLIDEPITKERLDQIRTYYTTIYRDWYEQEQAQTRYGTRSQLSATALTLIPEPIINIKPRTTQPRSKPKSKLRAEIADILEGFDLDALNTGSVPSTPRIEKPAPKPAPKPSTARLIPGLRIRLTNNNTGDTTNKDS